MAASRAGPALHTIVCRCLVVEQARPPSPSLLLVPQQNRQMAPGASRAARHRPSVRLSAPPPFRRSQSSRPTPPPPSRLLWVYFPILPVLLLRSQIALLLLLQLPGCPLQHRPLPSLPPQRAPRVGQTCPPHSVQSPRTGAPSTRRSSRIPAGRAWECTRPCRAR